MASSSLAKYGASLPRKILRLLPKRTACPSRANSRRVASNQSAPPPRRRGLRALRAAAACPAPVGGPKGAGPDPAKATACRSSVQDPVRKKSHLLEIALRLFSRKWSASAQPPASVASGAPRRWRRSGTNPSGAQQRRERDPGPCPALSCRNFRQTFWQAPIRSLERPPIRNRTEARGGAGRNGAGGKGAEGSSAEERRSRGRAATKGGASSDRIAAVALAAFLVLVLVHLLAALLHHAGREQAAGILDVGADGPGFSKFLDALPHSLR